MSKIVFSKMNDGYSPREVDVYVDMIETEYKKAEELITAQTTKIAELENVISKLTFENSQLLEDSKRFDLEIYTAQEEVESLKKRLEDEMNKKSAKPEVFQDKDALVEAILSLARANEKLVGSGNVPKEKEVYHSRSQVDEIVDNVLSEGNTADTLSAPRFSL